MNPAPREGPVVPTRYWHALPDGRVQCDLCPRFCRLHEDQRGLCFVRARRGGAVVLRTYGRSSGFCIDPIEKKPLYHFLPGTAALSFGTAGCNLTCKFCQNWDISKSRSLDALSDAASPERIAGAARDLGCGSVAFTYNDPIVFHEYAIDTADACRAVGLRTVAVTSGYVCAEPRAEFYRRMDAVNVDLKAFTETFYRRVCGGHVQPVLETLIYLKSETRVWLEVTNLLVPGWNDTEAEIEEMTRWMVEELGADTPLHFTAFHPDWLMRDTPPTPVSTLVRARRIALRNGLRYVYTGNVDDLAGGSTFCPVCGETVIARGRGAVTGWQLTHGGACRFCNTALAGVFEGVPGSWDGRSVPVRLTPAPVAASLSS